MENQPGNMPKLFHSLLPVSLFLCSCLFDSPDKAAPKTNFDFSLLENLENPLSKWHAIPKEKTLVGVKFAFRTMNYASETDSNITAFAAEAGGLPAVAGAYFDISAQPGNLRFFLEAVQARNGIPFVTFDPKDFDHPDIAYQRTFIAKINRQEFDGELKAIAQTLKAFARPVLFRFAHEMNGDWYPYSGVFAGGKADSNGNGKADGPENYALAWRHVHDLFGEEGVTNLVWIFCPNYETFPNEAWNQPFEYFPGWDYVDMLSVDTYESPDKRIVPLEQALDVFYNQMGLYLEAQQDLPGFKLKPFGLSEFGTYRPDARDKAAWYGAALQAIAGNGRIKLHVLYNARNGVKDFSIAGLGESLKAAFASERFLYGPI